MKDNKHQESVIAESRFRKGLWSTEEDNMLLDYVNTHGKGHWNSVSRKTELKRSGKSCRLRWMNYLSPSVKRDRFTEDEEDLIIRLHRLLGNRWALIAGRVPGRTDNQVKNHWNTHLSKKIVSQGIPNSQHPCNPDATTHNGKLKSYSSSYNHKSIVDDQAISSDFSSNTPGGIKSNKLLRLQTEAANREDAEAANREDAETDIINKSVQFGAQKANKAGEVEQTETDVDGRDDVQGTCFMQYLDDYTLQFVLSNNQRNIATAGGTV